MAGDSSGFYDFGELFGSELLSDVTLVLTCSTEADSEADSEGPPAKRQRRAEQDTPDAAAETSAQGSTGFIWASGNPCGRAPAGPSNPVSAFNCEEQLLPGHGVVLMGCSPVFKAELTRWRQQDEHGDRPRITLRVDSQAELEAARALLCFMYQQRLPDDASQQLLMALLQLADRFQVQACTAACIAALSTQEMSDEALEQVLRLPPFYSDMPLFAGVWDQAADRLQQLYGDLEQTSAQGSTGFLGRVLFLALPLKGVELLLGDARTKVAYENTALAAVSSWISANSSSITADDTSRLARLIRIPHLTPFFGSTVALQLPWLVEALGINTLGTGLGIAQALRGPGAPTLDTIMCHHEEYGWPKSWALGKRPKSAQQEHQLRWRVSPEEVKAVFEDADGTRVVKSSEFRYGGYAWRLRIDRQPCDKSTATLGVYLTPSVKWADTLPQTARVPVMVTGGSIRCLHKRQKPPVVLVFDKNYPPATQPYSWGRADFWCTGPMSKWDAAEFEQWTDSTGQLILQVKISEIM